MIARTFATNNVGLAATFHPFVAAMAQRGSGALVGIASVAGIRGLPGHGAYCASKAAVISYCESLRGELRASGVKVVTICPGYIDTPLTRAQPLRHAVPDDSPRISPSAPSAPSKRAPATASSPGRWAWWPSCCGCCPTRCSTGLLAGRPRKQPPGRAEASSGSSRKQKGSREEPLLMRCGCLSSRRGCRHRRRRAGRSRRGCGSRRRRRRHRRGRRSRRRRHGHRRRRLAPPPPPPPP